MTILAAVILAGGLVFAALLAGDALERFGRRLEDIAQQAMRFQRMRDEARR